jgi:vitamin B12 transporter
MKVLSLIALSSLPFAINAQDIIVTADRIKSSFEKSPSDIRVFSADEIDRAETIIDLLKTESDLQIAQSGGPGSNASLFLRGSDSSHTLVVIDDIVMNDPSNPNRQFDIGRLSLNNIERVEILKGSQGLLYGSNAIGGVIVMTSKQPQGDQLSGSTSVDYGSFNSLGVAANSQKKFGPLALSLGIDHFQTDGFSAANLSSNPNADDDSEKRLTISFGANQNITKNTEVIFNYRFMKDDIDLDKGGGPGNDDPNDFQLTEEQYLKAGLKQFWDNGETHFYYTKNSHHRTLNTLPDAASATRSSVVSKGVIDTFAINHTQYTTEFLTQNLNIDFQHEEDQSRRFNENLSTFLYNRIEAGKNVFNLGARLDSNKYFGEHLTYKTAYLYNFDKNIFKASYSTGFRAPSLNQLYDPTYGNKNLNPEKSQSAEMGIDIPLGIENKYTGTLFYTDLKNRLSYDPVTFVNQNRGRARIIGLENRIDINMAKMTSAYLAATWLSAKDMTSKKKLVRRPDLSGRAGLKYQYESHTSSIDFNYTGKRNDVDNLGNIVKMKAHHSFDLEYKYAINQAWSSYGKVKNILNEYYEDIYGYGSGGRAATLGMKYIF